MAEIKRRTTLQIWGDVIFALFIRELRSKFNDKFGITWALVEPLSFILLLSYGRTLITGGDEVHTMPAFSFMMYGMLLVQLFLNVLAASAAAIKRNKPLYAFRQVQPISAVISATLQEALIKLFVYAAIILFMFFVVIEIRMDNALVLGLVIFLLVLFTASLGLLFGLAELYVEEVQKVRQIITRPIFFISGVFFSLQDMPQEYWPYLNWNPVLHAIELSRQAAYQSFGAKGVDLSFLVFSTLIMLFLALSCYRVFWKGAISR
ncbi:ABC transporter permease [Neiella marina]|uniref:ABC transporter permease n=1 Tax=Neiella marina TaxID=508461 RepID=UPI000B3C1B94|nr:ABC transporter permease [Neiella marina]